MRRVALAYFLSARRLFVHTCLSCDRGDKRQRQEYAAGVRTCRLETIRGANVLPWEAPAETCATIAKFCAEVAD